MTAAVACTIRPATEADIAAITDIFALEVQTGTASWAEQPPDTEQMLQSFLRNRSNGYPWLCAEWQQQVIGYCYASAYRPRIGYRYLVENSVYVRKDMRGKRVASALLRELIETCGQRGYRQMIAVIGDSNNLPSIELHRSLGFREVGRLPSIGYKFNRWLDSVLMQRELGDGDASSPGSLYR